MERPQRARPPAGGGRRRSRGRAQDRGPDRPEAPARHRDPRPQVDLGHSGHPRELRGRRPAGLSPVRTTPARLVQPEVGQGEGGAVLEAGLLDRLAAPAVDDHGHPDHLGTRLLQRLGRGQRAATGRGDVLDHEHRAALDVGPLDPPLQTVRLPLLADDAGVQVPLAVGGRVQHRRRDWVRAQSQPADDVVAQVAGQLAHDSADQRGALVVQREPAHVDVPVGLPPRGERDLPAHDGQLDDELEQPVTVGQGGPVPGARPEGRGVGGEGGPVPGARPEGRGGGGGGAPARGPPPGGGGGGGGGVFFHPPAPTGGQEGCMPPRRIRLLAAGGPLTAAVVGGLATDPDSRWFRDLDKPSWYPPPQTFGIVWTGLYAGIAWAAGEVLAQGGQKAFGRAYAANLVLNAAWTAVFFRAHRPWLAAAESAVLTASTVDLLRRARAVSGPAHAVLAPYAAWTAFATALTVAIARRN